MDKEKPTALIVNTTSRKGKELFFQAIEELECLGINIAEAYPIHHASKLKQTVQDAITKGYTQIIIGGGDGSLTSVMEAFAYKDIILGVLPLGTGNSFARSLNIPLDLHAAIENLVHGKEFIVDLGVANGIYFANTCDIGFNSDIVRKTPSGLKGTFGFFAYLAVATQSFFFQKSFTATVIADGISHTIHTRQIIISNGTYFGVNKLSEDLHLTDNQIVILTLDDITRWELIKLWISIIRQSHTDFPETLYIKATNVEIATKPRKKISIDGEFLGKTPLDVTVAQKALRVIVPLSFEA